MRMDFGLPEIPCMVSVIAEFLYCGVKMVSSKHRISFEKRQFLVGSLALGLTLTTGLATGASAQSVAFKQAVAVAAAKDKDVLEFYKARDFLPIWTSTTDTDRRRAFIEAAAKSGDHALPRGYYDAQELKKSFQQISSAKALGYLEVQTTQKFLLYAQHIQSGILEPRKLDRELDIVTPRKDRQKLLEAFAKSNPRAFIRALPPQHPDYARLMKEKVRLEKVLGQGGWGPKIGRKSLKPGQKSKHVAVMRARLTAMGYKRLGMSNEFDEDLQKTVALFQADHGLNEDGVAGSATIDAMNVSAQKRLEQVIVGLERQRWLNKPRGKRHIFVNQADFRVFIVDDGRVTFNSRVVVGKETRFRTPEFSHEMTHMVINPTWHIPKSIARNEYLPMLKKNRNALARLGFNMFDATGRQIDSTKLDYSRYSAKNFPFDLKQPPSTRNALGLVKFMFPNRHNIYLHDTPTKNLFTRDLRAYSHGCVRVQKPFEFAYALLSPQSSNPKKEFQDVLAAGEEAQVDLVKPVPIHLAYHTAWVTPQGRSNFRKDTYGRDKKVFSWLQKSGVVLRAVQG